MKGTKLVLGGAQIGFKYGVTNTSGQISNSQVDELFKYMAIHKIDRIDTAQNYGNSENIIGALAPIHFKINTKISGQFSNRLNELILSSKNKLRNKHIDTIFIHDWEELSPSQKKAIHFEIKNHKDINWGVSLYSPKSVDITLDSYQDFTDFQIPINCLDQRFLSKVNLIKEQNLKRVWARSVFLQGALDFMSQANPFRNHDAVQKFRNFADTKSLSFMELAIGFVKSVSPDFLIAGCTNLAEFQQIHSQFALADISLDGVHVLSSNDMNLIDPRRWSR
jgi:aryl-alcohol dehydrogenase-like predicted oxidoreductase